MPAVVLPVSFNNSDSTEDDLLTDLRIRMLGIERPILGMYCVSYGDSWFSFAEPLPCQEVTVQVNGPGACFMEGQRVASALST